nr:4'-phosphopantetheinyl transferase superfamily protein [uncultured Carboxylicivirga sp.]
MPLQRIINKSSNDLVAIWQLKESVSELEKLIDLSQTDQKIYNGFRLDKRKKEWIGSRILLQEILKTYPQIEYGDNGKPFLKDHSKYISISHANGFVAVCTSNHPTALDIETCSPRVEKIASRFVHPNEWLYIGNENKINFLTLLWSAKETLYKYYDAKGVDFKDHFEIKAFDIQNMGSIQSHCCYNQIDNTLLLNYELTSDYALVYYLRG